LGGDSSDILKRLQRAELVVGVHDGDEHGLWMLRQRVFDGGQVDSTVQVHREIGDGEAVFLKSLAAI
jgi:hypothetical protein